MNWPVDGPKRVWKTNVGIGSSGVAVSQGRLFATGWTGARGEKSGTETVFCFDAVTGKEIWKQSYPAAAFTADHEGGSGATPTVDDSVVFTLSRSGRLTCFDAATGNEVWKKDLGADFGGRTPFYGSTSTPLVLDDKLIVIAGGEGASTIALNKKTGEVIWKSGRDEAAYAAPIAFELQGKKAVAVFHANGLVALNAASGTEQSRIRWVTMSPRLSSINAATPIADGNRIFLTSGYGLGCALLNMTTNPATPLWRHKDLMCHYSTPVLYRGALYGFHTPNEWFGAGVLKCVDWQTGKTSWEVRDPGWGSLIVADGKLLILGRKGELIIADAVPVAYKELARTQVIGGTTRSEPVLVNGKIYVKNVAGEIVCLDVK